MHPHLHPRATIPPEYPPRPNPWLPPAPPPASPGPTAPSTVVVGGDAEWLHRHLLERRVVLARGPLDNELATLLCAQLLTLDAEGDEPVELHLSVSQADPDAALTVLDAIDAMRAPVHAIAIGTVAGPAIAVFAAAAQRLAFPHATFHLTEPRLHVSGPASELAAQEARHRAVTEALLARLTAVTGNDLAEDVRRGRFLSAAEALDLGLVTRLTSRQ